MEINIEGIIIIIVSIIGAYYIYNYYANYGLISVKSNIDNNNYIVQIKDDSLEAANLIAKIREKLVILMEHLEKSYGKEDKRIKLLIKNFRPDRLKEGVSTPGYTSYSINKGEQIILCLRNNDKLVDINTLFFVVLHEFAHLATESIGHTEEFWDNFRWILEEAMNIGLYIKQEFKIKNVEYCGMTITSSPIE
jgi:hypothetical protein